MPKYKCEKCGREFYGWATSATCPDCGGGLKISSTIERVN